MDSSLIKAPYLMQLKVSGPDADKLATIAARFSYFQDKKISSNVINKIDIQRKLNTITKCKNSRPTVRLRPRQVLCNNCRSICNEKNENVDGSKKRKFDDSTLIVHEQGVRRSERRNSQQTEKINRTNDVVKRDLKTLIPKISRLRTNKIVDEVNNVVINDKKKNIGSSLNTKTSWLRQRAEVTARNNSDNNLLIKKQCSTVIIEPSESIVPQETNDITYCATPRRLSSSSVESAKIPDNNQHDNDNINDNEKTQMVAADSTVKQTTTTATGEVEEIGNSGGRISRKKRSVGSMEDLWDETIFEDNTRNIRTTPIIKISFGSQGEGTILKIPSKIKNSSGESETEMDIEIIDKNEIVNVDKINEDALQEQLDPQKQNYNKDTTSAKAAKRALKRAKKEARKMLNINRIVSPGRSPLGSSPRYNPSYDPLLYHRRKHKVKHKKKHRDDRKHKNQEEHLNIDQKNISDVKNDDTKETTSTTTTTIFNIIPTIPVERGESYMAIKEQCLKKKLSISLKRLNTNAYARCDYPVSNGSSDCKSPDDVSSEDLSELEPENNDINKNQSTPEFPSPSTHPLAIRLGTTSSVTYCLTASGRRMDVGDVVWGKIHGFPWWPGKVLSISLPCKDDSTPPDAQAHVAWYGSSTCSLMSCDRLSPFLEMFKARYNKKKRGPYKEAIRQAQTEAQIQTSLNTTNDVLKVDGSPCEVNVIS
ncbi:hypothetical protein HCN44_005904 [Aphidius gifuensis]|uniref:PWWP domain-containing protein n=1 Tax=Aphidius gifuensis TaxID=684658 RepID=A0A835CTB9_APHGI|nr:hypothetical protein HCN44_005904 [Aphidius gifuensis]